MYYVLTNIEEFSPIQEHIQSKRTSQFRYHHYYFVQQVLFHFIKTNSADSMMMFWVKNMDHNLQVLWNKTYIHFSYLHPEMAKVDSEGLPYKVTIKDELETFVVITMP